MSALLAQGVDSDSKHSVCYLKNTARPITVAFTHSMEPQPPVSVPPHGMHGLLKVLAPKMNLTSCTTLSSKFSDHIQCFSTKLVLHEVSRGSRAALTVLSSCNQPTWSINLLFFIIQADRRASRLCNSLSLPPSISMEAYGKLYVGGDVL